MHPPRTAALAVGLTLAVPARPLAAQIDYRNLDRERPVATEDAYPVERHAFELLLPLRTERERGGDRLHLIPLEVEYGMLDNTQVGVGLPIASLEEAGSDAEWGFAGLGIFALYNFNTEGLLLPAIALRADAVFPVGSLGGDETQVSFKGIVTRSWGPTRLHLNGAVRLGRDAAGPVVEGIERWWCGAALDRTLFRHSLLLVGEVYASRAMGAVPAQVNASLGLRWQWRPTAVLDIGISRRLRNDLGPDYAVTVGISNAFVIAGLIPRGR